MGKSRRCYKSLLLVLSLLSAASGVCYGFSRKGPGIADVRSSRVWNLTGTVELDGKERNSVPRYIFTRNDSLMSEIIDGRRQRYVFHGDTLLWTGEENEQMIAVCDTTPRSFAFPDGGYPTENLISIPYTAHGRYGVSAGILQKGIYTTTTPEEGMIMLGTDTIPGELRAETREFTMGLHGLIPTDSLITTDTGRRYRYDRYRWFATGSRLPVAVQTDAFVTDTAGRTLRAYSVLYTREISDEEREKYAERGKRRERGEKDQGSPFGKITTERENGGFRLNITGCTEPVVTVAVTSPEGIVCYTSELDTTGDVRLFIDTRDFPPGRHYILSLRAGKESYKELISRY